MKVKTARDVLTDDELSRYHKEWMAFSGKYSVNSSRNVHSGMPVISEVYRFDDSNIFRAHILAQRLRRFDPYHKATSYTQPFWHAQHYMMVGEQMYTASSRLVLGDQYDRMVAKDIPSEFNWKRPIFFSDNVSVELLREDLGKVGAYDKQAGYFTFYSDKTRKILSQMSACSFWQPRSYIGDMHRIREGDPLARRDLVRKIIEQAVRHSRLNVPRKSLETTKEELIDLLERGNLPEDKLHDFFSLWDPVSL